MEKVIRRVMIVVIIIIWITTSLGPINLLFNNNVSNNFSNTTIDSQYNGIGSTQNEFTTASTGVYFIGLSPSEYASGLEEPYEITSDGVYTAGVEFPNGIYDVVITSGSGTVTLTNSVNEVLYTSELTFDENSKSQTLDNIPLPESNSIVVEGVTITLEPQTNDTANIQPGAYDIYALSSGGEVIIVDANDNVVLRETIGTDENISSTYGLTQVELNEGYILINYDVELQLLPTVKQSHNLGIDITK